MIKVILELRETLGNVIQNHSLVRPNPFDLLTVNKPSIQMAKSS